MVEGDSIVNGGVSGFWAHRTTFKKSMKYICFIGYLLLKSHKIV